jgi:hypothetical protein
MKKILTLLFVLQFVSVSFLFAQKTENVAKESKSYPIDGTHLLWNEDAQVAEFLKANPDYFAKARLNKTTAWNFNIGTTRTWSAVDFSNNNSRYTINTTCRAVGEKCYIFVEDAVWNSRVNQVAVDSIQAAFDKRTPADATKGIYQTDTETFGNPPDVDNDSRIIIVLMDIKDGYDGSGGFVEGYFSSANELSPNKAEMFFIDANPLDLRTASGLQGGMSTLAHEFQHMILWNYHQTSSQLTFVNEGCSLVAEVINGYPIYSQGGYISETNHYLLDWRATTDDNVLKDYSRAARFNVYLKDQFGVGIFKYITQSSAYGLDAYKDAFSKIGSTITIDNLLQNWFVANNLDDRTINSSWGYLYSGLDKAYGLTYYNPNTTVSSSVEQYAVEYVSFMAGSNLSVQFSSNSSVLKIKAIKIGAGNKDVVDVPINGTFTMPEFGSTYSSVTFAVMNPTTSIEQTYSYQASGINKELELKWEDTEPVGYLTRVALDTICVTFDAISGGRLDSIRVAARRIGTLTGAVYAFTGTTNPSTLGTRLSNFFTLTSTITPPVVNSTGTYPYASPYPNWLKMDLSSQNIKTDNAIAVAFGVPQDESTFARILVAKHVGTSPYHSFTYQSTATTPGWYYLTDGAGSVWIYLIRAYIGFGTTTKVVELTPSNFKLEQNYPNPFNPATKIQYSLEKAGNTKLVVYDMMGREVKTLLNDYQTSGTHEISFDAKDFSSGVYYYKLQNNDMVSVRKMVLMK